MERSSSGGFWKKLVVKAGRDGVSPVRGQNVTHPATQQDAPYLCPMFLPLTFKGADWLL